MSDGQPAMAGREALPTPIRHMAPDGGPTLNLTKLPQLPPTHHRSAGKGLQLAEKALGSGWEGTASQRSSGGVQAAQRCGGSTTPLPPALSAERLSSHSLKVLVRRCSLFCHVALALGSPGSAACWGGILDSRQVLHIPLPCTPLATALWLG